MQESFLHYIWQFQYFDRTDLGTTANEPIVVFNGGFRNLNSGPDFSNARIRIGAMEWIGHVEIHVYSSGWNDHKHDLDPAYDNVILHVVWDDDAFVRRKDGTVMPTLVLKKRVDENLLLRYNSLLLNPEHIACAGSLNKVQPLTIFSMKERALVNRLESRSIGIHHLLKQNMNDWEETCFQVVCRNFGFKINADPFEVLGRRIAYRTIMKHGDKLVQIEALLFGQAGLLEEEPRLPLAPREAERDDYFRLLAREYQVLSQKFDLREQRMNKVQWRFLRLRPANFPTIRIAQLSALLARHKNLFSVFIDARNYEALAEKLHVDQSDYWKHHYLFGKLNRTPIPGLGKMSVDNLIINSVIPMMVAYGKLRDEQEYTDRAIAILQELEPEDNRIVNHWKEIGLSADNAFDSQALIELNNEYCIRKRCLDCSIGASLVKPP